MIGRTIAHYELLDKLGEGGMGVVYRAEDTALEREVALKLLPAEVASDADRLERFRSEAKTVAQLNHPNIVTIYSVEEAESDEGVAVHFFTMELVRGVSLERLLPTGGLPVEEFFDLATQLTEAVSAAHERGCVHRDLKPANVMVTAEGRVKILDFGLAKLFGYTDSERLGQLATLELSEKTGLAGTLPYMSPEQVSMQAVDRRSDIFSLAVVLYEMATGRRPFGGVNVVHAIRTESPASVEEIRPELSGLGELLGECLTKDPDARLADARVLKERLERLRDELLARSAEPPEWSLAVLPFRMLSRREELTYFGDGLAEELIRALSRVEMLRVAGARSTVHLVEKGLPPEEISRVLQVAHFLEGSVRDEGSHLRVTAHLCAAASGYELWGESFDYEWGDVLEIQDRICRAIVEALRLHCMPEEEVAVFTRDTEDAEAHALYLKGRYFWNKRYEGGLESAISFFAQAIDKAPDYGRAHAGLADCFMILGWYAIRSPSEAFPKAKQAAQTAVRLAPSLGEAHSSLAAVSHLYDWDWEAAGRHFERAVELNPRYAYGRLWYAFYLMTRGETDESLRQSGVANRLDPVNLSVKAMAGWLHFLAREDAAAEEILEEALSLEGTFGITNIFLAWLYEEQERWEEAFAAWTRVEDAWRVPETGQPLPSLRLPRCHTLAVSGQREEAARLLGELQAMEAAGAYLSPAQKAAVQLALGDRQAAFAALAEASEIRDCWLLSVPLDPRFSRDREFRRDPRFGEILGKARLRPLC